MKKWKTKIIARNEIKVCQIVKTQIEIKRLSENKINQKNRKRGIYNISKTEKRLKSQNKRSKKKREK